ncbi:hypothetical protein F5148DRAFT_1146172 [Russula earlei]|uniref:Uncharacterized protein n=1 Tax=Russula earlei TaxID=71964 RepID=A0ACC0UL29_9AGAM|nr:hypothetical protein F5148DRAFT_1146172 [Russula earlei]
MAGAEVSLHIEHGCSVAKQGACISHIGAVAAAVNTEVMAAASKSNGSGERGWRHGDKVFTTAGGGSTCGCNGRGGEVQCGACIGGVSCGDIMVVGSDHSAGWHCGICFSEAVACVLFIFLSSVHSFLVVQGGIMARDGSVRAGMAEGVVAMAGCASNMADMTEEAEAEAAEDETGMEMGDKEVVGIDVMAGVGDVETGVESAGADDAETMASQTEKAVWDRAAIGGTCMATMEMAGDETTEVVMGDVEEVVVAGDTTEGMGVASHHGYTEFLRPDLRVGMN